MPQYSASGGAVIPQVPQGTPAPISVADISTPQTPLAFRQTAISSIPTMPELTLTKPEEEAQGQSTALQEVNRKLIGESAFRTEQEGMQDITGKNQTVNDLTNRLNILKNEESAIPIRLQEEAKGRGITAGGMAPIQTSELRKNAIQSLSVGALLQAANGNLTTALDLVDRSVKAKYDPVREEIAVLKANLELIKNSPNFSLADKKRAQAQLDAQKAREDALKTEEQNDKDKQTIAVDAAGRGANADILRRIQNAPNAVEAQRIATESGYPPQAKADDTQVVDVGGRKKLIDSRTGAVIKDLGASSTSSEGGTFSSDQLNKGAANAAVSAKDFVNLPSEVQNIFINNKEVAADLVDIVAASNDGETSREEALEDIEASPVSRAVKDFFISRLTSEAESNNNGGGGGLWDWVKGFFGGGGSDVGISEKSPTQDIGI